MRELRHAHADSVARAPWCRGRRARARRLGERLGAQVTAGVGVTRGSVPAHALLPLHSRRRAQAPADSDTDSPASACTQTLSIVVDHGSDQVRAHTAFGICWHAQLLNCLVRRTGDVSPRTRNASKPRPRTRSASKPSPRTRKASKPSSRTRSASKPSSRTRSASKLSPRTRSASKQRSDEFICPECSRSFARAAALGAHRRSAHGITGASSSAARARANTASARRQTSTAAARRRPARAKTAARSAPRRTAGRPPSAQPLRPRRTTADGQRRVVDRDALLRSLFPNGIPPTEQALQQVNAWLEQAEQLTRLR
jgi:hypothetical protein